MNYESSQLLNGAALQGSIRAGLVSPTNSFIEFEKQEIEQTIADRFEQHVAKYPQQIAVRTPDSIYTYDALDKAANRVAWAILDRPQRADESVALLFENGAPFVIASLAAMKAGTIQVPLESTFPQARLRYILEHSQARLVITDSKNISLARQLSNVPTINIDELTHRYADAAPARKLPPDTPVAIGYTSGSTGQPKGIVWNHRGVLHAVMRHTNHNRLCATDRIIMFRAALRPMLYPLLNGATYYPFNLRANETAELNDWLIRERITIYRAAVSVFRSFAGSLTGKEKFAELRLIFLFGEAVHRTDIELYKKHFADHAILGASLGCNEYDDYAAFFVNKKTSLPSGVLPGGYPIGETNVLILDERGHTLGVDKIGEIVIHSRYNAIGYWQRPDLTQAAFVPDPANADLSYYHTGDLGRRGPDGCLYHHGRTDFQVKIRGYRVEVSEVEAALREIEGVREAVVVGNEVALGDWRLVAYIIGTYGRLPRIGALRHQLSGKLPDYMVPWTFMVVDSMPLTATGKVDRLALPMPDGTRPAVETPYQAPGSAIELQLAEIWSEVLALKQVGIHDDFLELGGDSLLAMQVISRVLGRFRVAVTQRELFDAATISEMATLIDAIARKSAAAQNITKLLADLESMSKQKALHRVEQIPRQQRK